MNSALRAYPAGAGCGVLDTLLLQLPWRLLPALWRWRQALERAGQLPLTIYHAAASAPRSLATSGSAPRGAIVNNRGSLLYSRLLWTPPTGSWHRSISRGLWDGGSLIRCWQRRRRRSV